MAAFLAELLAVAGTLPCPTTQSELRALWLSPSYDKLRRPADAVAAQQADWPRDVMPPPDDVFVNLQVNALKNVDAKEQTITLDNWVRTIWFDPRLAFNDSCMGTPSPDGDGSWSFDGSYLEELWFPEFYSPAMPGSVTPRGDIVKSSAFWLSKDGKVWWTREVQWTPRCPMGFQDMPYDFHTCNIIWTGFRQHSKEISVQLPAGQDFLWGLQGVRFGCSPGSIEWTLLSVNGSVVVEDGQGLASGVSKVKYAVSFRRNPAYYEIYFLVPMFLMFVIAWSSFFVARAAVPARVAMVIIAFLSMSGTLNAVLSTLPKQGYHVWILDVGILHSCVVFFAILEYVGANFLMRKEAALNKATDAAKKRLADKAPPVQAAAATERTATEVEVQVGAASGQAGGFELVSEVRKSTGRAERLLLRRDKTTPTMWLRDQDLDIFCRYAFPVVYAIAMIVLLAKVPSPPDVDAALLEVCE